MKSSIQRLIDYYESPMFATDFELLQGSNGEQAIEARRAIANHFRFNLAVLGREVSPEEVQLHSDFEAGRMEWLEMLELVKRYVRGVVTSRQE